MIERPILFLDVMDTLVHNPFFVEVPDFFGLDLDALFAAKTRGVWEAFERGEIDEAELAARYFQSDRPLDLPGLRACMSEAYRFLPGMEPLLAELHQAGHEIHALSNYPQWWRMIEAKLTLSRFMSWRFVSCRTGVRKPDAEAYLGAARALKQPPGSCLFVDDSATNCEAAEALGMPSVRFVDAPSLRAALVERRLLGA